MAVTKGPIENHGLTVTNNAVEGRGCETVCAHLMKDYNIIRATEKKIKVF